MKTKLTINDILEVFPGSKIIDDKPFEPIEHAGKFLSFLYGDWKKNFLGQYFEIRLLGDGYPEQWFYNSPDELIAYDLPALLENQAKGNYGIYFGVCPRVRKSGKNDDIKAISALWADIDNGRSMGQLMSNNPKPDIVVFSGHGYHAYWKLKAPAQANELSSKTLRAIQKAVGSDSVSDFARVMRLPGSLNLKDPKNPKLCKVVWMGEKNAV